MTTAFDVATDAIFADPNMGVAASWRAGGTGVPTPCTVILAQPDLTVPWAEATITAPEVVLSVRAAEIGTPGRSDTFTVAAVIYSVVGQPERDALRLVWSCKVRAA